jgi:hypothetical protein
VTQPVPSLITSFWFVIRPITAADRAPFRLACHETLLDTRHCSRGTIQSSIPARNVQQRLYLELWQLDRQIITTSRNIQGDMHDRSWCC